MHACIYLFIYVHPYRYACIYLCPIPQIIKGSDPIEIRTPPVVQVSLNLAVSIDDFFNVGELIHNLAFALRIDPSRIRVVE